jgi:hypothetical protein
MASKTHGKQPRRSLTAVHARAAGLDVGATFHVVAVPPDRAEDPVRTFQSFTGDLQRLADWLTEVGVTTVAMESTGVYTSLASGRRCREAGVVPSMGSTGDCFDNALAESFFASLECELVARSRWRTHAEARLAVFDYIEGFG